MPDAFLGYLLSAGAMLLFSATILVTKVASSRINLAVGFLVATLVNVVFAALALALQLIFSSKGLGWHTEAFLLFATAGCFATYLGRWFFYESVVRFGPARASIFQITSPLFTALIAWLFLGEKLSMVIVGGMGMTILGLALVSYKPGVVVGLMSGGGTADVSLVTARLSRQELLLQSIFLLGLCSAMAYAVGNVLRGSAIRLWNEPIVGALAGALFGLTLHLIFSAKKSRGLLTDLRSADRLGLWLYVLIGVCNISGQIGVIGAMRYIPLSFVALITMCSPLLVIPLSHVFFKGKDDITVRMIAGSALTLLGIVVVVLR